MKNIKVLVILSCLSIFGLGNFTSAETGWGIFARLYHQQDVSVEQVVEVSTVVDLAFSNDILVEPVTAELGLLAMRQGRTISLADQKFSITLLPNSIVRPTGVELKQVVIDNIPWNLKQLSSIYQFDLDDDLAMNREVGLKVRLSYEQSNDDFKQVYYYNSVLQTWKPLPSVDFPGQQYVEADVRIPYAQLAVFSHPGVMTVGKASWYAYKDCDCAASPDFAKGSIIRVTNVENGRSLDVTINDWGPERDKHPERAIDLDKLAFAKLASIGAGIIDVELQPLHIVPDVNGKVLGVKEYGVASQPILQARSAIIMDDKGQILYNKAGDTVAPLASLTKLVAVYTFLDLRPNLFSAVEYQYVDEKFNHEYCNPWESSRVKLNDGDLLLIKDLVYSSLVKSANNAVESLARVSGLPRDEFIKRMNDNVLSWGARQTRFVEPTGLSVDNVSTAQDYAIIIREVFKNELIAQASIESRYEFYTINTNEIHAFRNTNSLVNSQPSIVGSKTGYLHEAGFCLATKVHQAGRDFYIVTLGAPNRQVSFDEMSDLITYASSL